MSEFGYLLSSTLLKDSINIFEALKVLGVLSLEYLSERTKGDSIQGTCKLRARVEAC